MQKIYKLLNLGYYLLRFGSFRMAWFLSKHGFPIERIREVGIKNGQLLVRKTGQLFSMAQLMHCKESLSLFLSIATHQQLPFFAATRVSTVTHLIIFMLYRNCLRREYIAYT